VAGSAADVTDPVMSVTSHPKVRTTLLRFMVIALRFRDSW
jgi:hypothetical protein